MRSASQSKLSVQVVRGEHNSAVRQDLSPWARPDASAGPAGRGTRRAATDDTPPRSPRQAHNFQQLLKRAKFCIFGQILEAEGGRPGSAVAAVVRDSALVVPELIAQ